MKRQSVIMIRLTAVEEATVRRAAIKAGIPLAVLARTALIERVAQMARRGP